MNKKRPEGVNVTTLIKSKLKTTKKERHPCLKNHKTKYNMVYTEIDYNFV